jgi:hypothetical protein
MHKVTIRPVGRRYDVIFEGAVIIEKARDPEFTVCRELQARGLSGTVEFWREGASYPSLRMDIAWAAEHRVEETEKVGPRVAKWRAFSRSDVAPPEAILTEAATPLPAAA